MIYNQTQTKLIYV